jgi:hypothetical protein
MSSGRPRSHRAGSGFGAAAIARPSRGCVGSGRAAIVRPPTEPRSWHSWPYVRSPKTRLVLPCSAVPRTCHTTRTIEVAPGRSVRVGAQLNSPSPFVHTVCKQGVPSRVHRASPPAGGVRASSALRPTRHRRTDTPSFGRVPPYHRGREPCDAGGLRWAPVRRRSRSTSAHRRGRAGGRRRIARSRHRGHHRSAPPWWERGRARS